MSGPAPGSAEWLRLVTASKVAAILGLSPFESPRSLWHRMRGELPPVDVSAAMARGTYLEPSILAWWRDQHPEYGHVLDQHYATRPDVPWGAATLDALAIGEDEAVAVEVKTTSQSDEWGQPGTDAIPTHYLTQVYWQLAMCPEASRSHVAVLGPFLTLTEYVVERDEAIQADLIERCRAFHESLSADVPPPLDDHVATLDALKALHPDIDKGARVEVAPSLAAEYLTAVEAEKAAAARARAAKSAVLDAAGRAQYVTSDGTRIARRQPSKHGVSLIATATTTDLTTGAAA